jgi:cytidylate kinase
LLDYLTEGDSQVIVSPPATAEIRSEAVRAFIRNAIQEVAARGNAVIVAHAASYAVGTERQPLRVLVTASGETRAQRVGAAEGLEDLEATRLIKKSDAGRADYLKRFYGVAVELPIHYDLVINTDALSAEQAAALIAQASRA